MFHRERDASKVALLAPRELLPPTASARLLDVQWRTPHLASLGVVEVPRAEYLTRLRSALACPSPALRPGRVLLAEGAGRPSRAAVHKVAGRHPRRGPRQGRGAPSPG